MKLTSENVDLIIKECLYTEEELPKKENQEEWAKTNGIHVEGLVTNYVFNPARINKRKDDIVSMVNELPDMFDDGWSFLNLCTTKDGVQWTGMHSIMEALCCLGMATGCMQLLSPREMWPMLPGGMPYYGRVKG